MKRTLFILMLMSLVCASFGQKALKAIDAKIKKLDKAKELAENPSKNNDAAVWIDYANSLMDVYNAKTAPLYQGMPMAFTPGLVGRPVGPSEKITTAQGEYTKYPFDSFDLYNDAENNVQFWVVTKELHPNALSEAYDCLKKAKDLSASDFVGSGKGAASSHNLKVHYETAGFAKYYLEDYENAGDLFAKAADAAAFTGVLDTNDYYYAGLLYNAAEQFDKSLSYLTKLKDMGYDQGGNVLCLIADMYTRQDKPEESLKVLDEATKKYPSNKDILLKTINAYVKANKDPHEIIETVHMAQKADPTNASLLLIEGSLFMEIGDNEKATAALKKAIEIDPKSYQAYYNLAVLDIQAGDAFKKEAEQLPLNDTKGYDEKMKLVIEKQNSAIQYLEKVYEIKPDDTDTITLLKQLYYPRRDKHMEERYEFFNNLYKNL